MKKLIVLFAVVLSLVFGGFYAYGGPVFGTGGTITGDQTINGALTVQDDITIDYSGIEAILVRKDGDTGDVFIVDSQNDMVEANEIRALSASGLKLNDDGGNGIFIENGGNVGAGTNNPASLLHIKGNTPGTVGSNPAGQLIIQNPADDVTAGVVITAYESDGSGNPDQQLWYLGSSSSSNEAITLLNRRNAALTLGTNGATRVTISGTGTTTFGSIMENTANTTNGIIQFTGTGYGLWVDTPLTGYSDTACWQGSSGGYLGHCSSSKRYKDNISDIPYGLADVMKLRPVEFDWNNRKNSVHDIGLIAEEVAEVIPEIIGYDDDGKVDGLNYRHLVAVLIKAVQEQQIQINELRLASRDIAELMDKRN